MQYEEWINVRGSVADRHSFGRLLADHSIDCVEIDDFISRCITIYNEYRDTKYSTVGELASQFGDVIKISRSIFPVYSKEDLDTAPLADLTLHTVWNKDVTSIWEKCVKCNGSLPSKLSIPVLDGFTTSRDCFFINGEVPAVSTYGKEVLTSSHVTGMRFVPLTPKNNYWRIIPKTDLGKVYFVERETLNWRGYCNECGWPLFDMAFGPPHFARTNWSGDDVVSGLSFRCDTIVTKRALEVFKKLSAKADSLGPIYLD